MEGEDEYDEEEIGGWCWKWYEFVCWLLIKVDEMLKVYDDGKDSWVFII